MKLKYFVVLVVLLPVAGIAFSVWSQTAPTPFRSFVVTSTMSSPQVGSPLLWTKTFTRAVREDGSWVTIYKRTPPFQDERDIKDFKSGVYTIVEDTTKSLVRTAIDAAEYKQRLTSAASCDGASAGQILGLNVTYLEETTPVVDHGDVDWSKLTSTEREAVLQRPAEFTQVTKKWLAPELGCFLLQRETIMTRNSDGFISVDTKVTPLSVVFQPVDELFNIPTSHIERTKEDVVNQLNQLNK